MGDAVDVGFALGEDVDLALIDVEAGDFKLLLAEKQGQRQAHVAQADDANPGLALLDLVLELGGSAICGRLIRHRCDRWSLLCLVNFISDSSTRLRARGCCRA